MSKIVLWIKHESPIWMAQREAGELKSFEHTWDGNKVIITDAHININCEVKLSDDEKAVLLNCLIKDVENFIPHWQSLTPDIHRTVQRIEKHVWEAASYVDHNLRKLSKGIRLTPLKLPIRSLNQSQGYPVMHWEFSEDEKRKYCKIFDHFKPNIKRQYERGILIPFPVSFDQKTIYLRDEEVKEFFDNLDSTNELAPFWNLYGIAWENFSKNKAYDSAILILATSMETAFKWCLQQHGEEISNYLIENMQSPSLDKLYDVVSKHTPYEIPSHFKGWLKQLVIARNFVAHKPRGTEINVLQIVRWFAMGEAILKAIINKESDPLVGCLIEPIGKNAKDTFPSDTIGVVLRREQFQYKDDSKLHVIIDTGESYYFSDNAYQVLSKNNQKFPDVK